MMNSGRILLIDDDELFRKLVNVMLTTAGFEVEEAANGKIGLACYRQQRADVVLTDILMPEREGLETIQSLKGLDPDVKIIAMSVGGDGRLGYLRSAIAFGARRTLHKPFSREELLSTLADVLPEARPDGPPLKP
jgi:DNA-binding NtrC family response regulator